MSELLLWGGATGMGVAIGLLIIRFVFIPLGIPSRQLDWMFDQRKSSTDGN